jgi:hypothetical protein
MTVRLLRRTLACVAGLIVALDALAADPYAPDQLLRDITYLASDELGGRMTGERGSELAARYIEKAFRGAGLEPAGDSGSYFQHFMATVGVRLENGNSLRVRTAAGDSTYVVSADFIPFAFSDTGHVSAPVLFAGYGITAPDLEYDDYAGVDASNKIVLLLRHEPGENDSTSVFNGLLFSQYADFRYKLMNARQHGAVGVLMVTDPLNHAGMDDDLVPLGSAEGFGGGDIPAVHAKRRIAEWLLASAGLDLARAQVAIDSSLTPQSREIPGVEVEMRVVLQRERRHVKNVIGRLAGKDPHFADQHVVIGAHYDHLGFGAAGSLAGDKEKGQAHHGADDNASGTAGVMALARDFGARARRGDGPARSVLFMAFTGEELGLLGSAYYSNHPTVPMDRTVAMINMDMIGRLRDGKVHVSGVGTSPGFHALVDSAAAGLGLRVAHGESGYGPSDHTSFYAKNVPVLFFFTGAHVDYHRPTDTWDKVNAAGESTVLRMVARTAERLANQASAIQFTKAAADTGSARGSSEGVGGGYGAAYMGTIPDFEEFEGGVKLTGVREGSPAEVAGIRGGDIIVGFAGRPIKNLYDYTYALRARRPGDVVVVDIVRDGKPIPVTVTLGKRRAG